MYSRGTSLLFDVQTNFYLFGYAFLQLNVSNRLLVTACLPERTTRQAINDAEMEMLYCLSLLPGNGKN